ncbi:hypothetical protein [Achromobacter ruhlandii]|uniref:hypothetical protein n=1 Tax=Achromobacter ruhlandii TaxID=72557 RepID=UPI003B9D8CE6
MTLGEFVFIMHDGGRGGSFLFKDIALARYREQVTDDTRRLTATHPPPPQYAGARRRGIQRLQDNGGQRGMHQDGAADGVAYIDYTLEPLVSRDEQHLVVDRDPDGAFRILGA